MYLDQTAHDLSTIDNQINSDMKKLEEALIEAHRIMKNEGRFVLDIPDNQNPIHRIMSLIEDHRGCPIRFDMSPQEFNVI
jgi:hypothetical protein